MKFFRPIKPLASGIAWLAILLALPETFAARQRPNIVFILADDLGMGDLACYGGDRCKIETPNADRLASAGVRFTDAHSSSSVCTPSRYGILTGRYNWRSLEKSGVLGGFSPPLIPSTRETIPSLLKKAGYDTACIGKWHLGMGFPTKDGKPVNPRKFLSKEDVAACNVDWSASIQGGPNAVGFDYFYGISASLDIPPFGWIENDRFVAPCSEFKKILRTGPTQSGFEPENVLPTLKDKAVEYVRREAKKGAPFFLYLALNSPHTPHAPSPDFLGKSKMGIYGDFVMQTDWVVGELLRALDETGLADRTLVVLTSDNGCSPAARRDAPKDRLRFNSGELAPIDPKSHYPSMGFRGHKADIYEGGHRIPLIVRWPGHVPAGSRTDRTVCLTDFFATFAEIAEQPYPPDAGEDSVSLLPLFSDPSAPAPRDATLHHSINGSFAVRQGNWKLALCPGSGGWSSPAPKKNRADLPDGTPLVQLYNLKEDPGERLNLAEKHPEKVNELTSLAKRYLKRGRSTPGPRQPNEGETFLYPAWLRTSPSPGK